MKGDTVPDSDHILRYVGGGNIETDKAGNLVFLSGGFIARPRDNNCTSYNWLEVLGTDGDPIQAVRDVSRLRYGKTGRLVRLNVGSVLNRIQDVLGRSSGIAVVHDPLDPCGTYPADESHSLMINVPHQDDPQAELIGDLIAQCAIDSYPAVLPSSTDGS